MRCSLKLWPWIDVTCANSIVRWFPIHRKLTSFSSLGSRWVQKRFVDCEKHFQAHLSHLPLLESSVTGAISIQKIIISCFRSNWPRFIKSVTCMLRFETAGCDGACDATHDDSLDEHNASSKSRIVVLFQFRNPIILQLRESRVPDEEALETIVSIVFLTALSALWDLRHA